MPTSPSPSRWLQPKPLALALLAIGFLAAGVAEAKPPHKSAIAGYYGDFLPEKLRACQLCHLTDEEISAAPPDLIGEEEQPWNALGRALAKLGKDQVAAGAARPEPIYDRLRSLADADADGDGVANELELVGGTWPGSAKDLPAGEQLAAAQKVLEKFRRSVPDYAWKPTSPVVRPAVPGPGNPIDAFIAAEQARQGLKAQPAAPKEVWLRRVSIDLIGLPPTRQQIAEFRQDESPTAHEAVVDRLLASPQYGERWGRHWMDVWRYSDWAGWGEQVRDSHPHIWRWRDWIVESLNADKPYDAMLVEMLAADEVAPEDEQALRATGFLVRNFKLLSREQWMLDTVDHTSRAFLGITFKCAQCHDHMYDPLRHEEYFQFRAIFEPYQVRIDQRPGELDTKKDGLSRVYDAKPDAKTLFFLRGDERTPDPDRPIVAGVPTFLGGEALAAQPVTLSYMAFYPALRPTVVADLKQQAEGTVERQQTALTMAEADPAQHDVTLAKLKLAAAEAERAALGARIAAEQAKYIDELPKKDAAAYQQLAQSASQLERASQLAAAEVALHEAQMAHTKAEQAHKDAPADKQEALAKGVAEAKQKLAEAEKAREAKATAAQQPSDKYAPLGEVYPQVSSGRRLALARWLTDRKNPLTARVAANHLWSRHFGRGIVETVDDFGQNGRRPTHPALLDWLAAELMEPTDAAAKPWSMKHLHRLIVLSNTYRASSVHDSASAEIDPENRYLWRMTPRRIEAEAVRDAVLHLAGSLDPQMGGPELDQQQALKIPRRSIYFRHAPEKQTQFLQLFDMAAPTECYRRRDSIIPQQALALANSELTVKQSRKLARKLRQDAGEDSAAFIDAAFWQILGRAPSAAELAECDAFLKAQTARFAAQAEVTGATDLTNLDLSAADPALHACENLAHVLLNHHEFVMVK